jgi:hypothetical protein
MEEDEGKGETSWSSNVTEDKLKPLEEGGAEYVLKGHRGGHESALD